jgi:hypothetical protein
MERVEQRLRVTLDMLVENLDYEGEPSSAPAMFARCIAMILADIEHGRRERVN